MKGKTATKKINKKKKKFLQKDKMSNVGKALAVGAGTAAGVVILGLLNKNKDKIKQAMTNYNVIADKEKNIDDMLVKQNNQLNSPEIPSIPSLELEKSPQTYNFTNLPFKQPETQDISSKTPNRPQQHQQPQQPVSYQQHQQPQQPVSYQQHQQPQQPVSYQQHQQPQQPVSYQQPQIHIYTMPPPESVVSSPEPSPKEPEIQEPEIQEPVRYPCVIQ